MKTIICACLCGLTTLSMGFTQDKLSQKKTNVILINADDLGYGDISCYGNKVFQTPHIDQLAKDGVRFTQAYSSAATCTPSRFSLLTGEYAWRKEGRGILPGDAKMIIAPGRQTIASLMKKANYKTGVIGKWHLGFETTHAPINFNQKIKNGPHQIGFDESFIMAATNDRVPSVFLKNQTVVGLDLNDPIEVSYQTNISQDPTGKNNPELLKMKHSCGHDGTIINGVGRIGFMKGGHAARWVDEYIAEQYISEAKFFINASKDSPFFLYFASQDPHVPRLVHPRFQGKSTLGPRGDAILQLDWSVGELTKFLKDKGLYDQTMIIFTSDNGPVLDDGYIDHAVELNAKKNHTPAGHFAGGKYQGTEGGSRVPFIVTLPNRMEKVKNTTSDAKIAQVDFLGVLAELTGQSFDSKSAIDVEKDQLNTWLGQTQKGRAYVVTEGGQGLGYIQDDFKLFTPKHTSNAILPENAKLFNLKTDIQENKNLLKSEVQIASDYFKKIEAIKAKK